MKKPLTIVIRRNGLLVLASSDVSTADAERWVEEGFQVFRIAVAGDRWAFNHVGSGRVMSDADAAVSRSDGPYAAILLTDLSPKKENTDD